MTARQDRSLKPQARARYRHTVTDLEPGQLAPTQAAEPEDRYQLGVPPVACLDECVELLGREELSLAARATTRWQLHGRGRVPMDAPIGDSEGQKRPQGGQVPIRRRGREPARDETTHPG